MEVDVVGGERRFAAELPLEADRGLPHERDACELRQRRQLPEVAEQAAGHVPDVAEPLRAPDRRSACGPLNGFTAKSDRPSASTPMNATFCGNCAQLSAAAGMSA